LDCASGNPTPLSAHESPNGRVAQVIGKNTGADAARTGVFREERLDSKAPDGRDGIARHRAPPGVPAVGAVSAAYLAVWSRE